MASLGPYRTAALSVADSPTPEAPPACPMVPVMLAAFAATAARVVSTLCAGEAFSAEPTLALLCAAGLGFGLLEQATRWLREA